MPGRMGPPSNPADERAHRTWLVLTPVGVEVEVRVSSAIAEPILVTSEQIQAVALAAVDMREAGLTVDVGALLTAMCRPVKDPAQQTLALDDDTKVAQEPRPAEFPCGCGITYGSQAMLAAHVRQNPSHDLKFIPAEHRVDE